MTATLPLYGYPMYLGLAGAAMASAGSLAVMTDLKTEKSNQHVLVGGGCAAVLGLLLLSIALAAHPGVYTAEPGHHFAELAIQSETNQLHWSTLMAAVFYIAACTMLVIEVRQPLTSKGKLPYWLTGVSILLFGFSSAFVQYVPFPHPDPTTVHLGRTVSPLRALLCILGTLCLLGGVLGYYRWDYKHAMPFTPSLVVAGYFIFALASGMWVSS